jgi:shikimate kinase
MVKRIYLTGFMTSGKSTLGQILANVLGWNFYDMDKELENDEGKKVSEIFETKGEQYFRNIESLKLQKLSATDFSIISLGGGTLINDNNLKLILQTGKLVYLKVTPEIIYKRIKNKIDRPLFRDFVLSGNSKEMFIKKIEGMLEERNKYYNKADLYFNVDDSPIGITVDRLAKSIKKILYEKNTH